MTTPEQWYAVVDVEGSAISFGRDVASEEELTSSGLTAVPVDRQPDENHDWDKATRTVRALTSAEKDTRDPRRVAQRDIEAKRTKARATGATTNDKMDYIIAMLEAR